jgi:hypothetical protein
VAKAYVETTVLTDALLKPGAPAIAARSAIGKFDESQLPVYSIKEMKAGPLHHYVWLHGKLVTTGSLEQALAQLHRMSMSPRRYWTSTAIEALRAGAHKDSNTMLQDLVKKYGNRAKIDAVNCDRYRFSLRSIIMRAWRERRKLTSSIVQELECYTEANITEERGLIELGETKCQPKEECSLAMALKADVETLKKLRAVVEAQPEKPENTRRAKALKELIRVPKQKLTAQQCRYLGDAIFAFFCPLEANILTTNMKDLRPLAEALGKKAQSPAEIQEPATVSPPTARTETNKHP